MFNPKKVPKKLCHFGYEKKGRIDQPLLGSSLIL
jgi:hypothetical protein